MNPVPHTLRVILVIALALSLGGGALFAQTATADCLGSFTAQPVTSSSCCCKDHCDCGPSCGTPDTEPQQDEPASTNGPVRPDLGNLNDAAGRVVVLQFGNGSLPALDLSASAALYWPQTLVAQHTCLRA